MKLKISITDKKTEEGYLILDSSEVKTILKNCGALWEGHFLFTSGLHGSTYIQCARVLQYPEQNEILCGELASRFKDHQVDVVLGAALGGIIVSYELARQLKARSIFAERTQEGRLKIRRGMDISEGENVLIAEDVITTGGTTEELLEVASEYGSSIVGIAALVNRNPKRADFNIKSEFLLAEVMQDYKPEDCPLCQKGLPLEKPGSRKA